MKVLRNRSKFEKCREYGKNEMEGWENDRKRVRVRLMICIEEIDEGENMI